MNCSGSEESIFSCNISSISSSTCTSDAGLICQGTQVIFYVFFLLVPLSSESGPQPSSCSDYAVRLDPSNGGKLLICFNGVWGAVCINGLQYSAKILCSQLGFQKGGEHMLIFFKY